MRKYTEFVRLRPGLYAEVPVSKSPLAQRILKRLEDLNKTATQAARDGGLGKDAIRNILRGLSAHPREDTLKKIAAGLDWSLNDLLGENVAGSGTPFVNVPLVSWVEAGSLTEPFDPYAVGRGRQTIVVPYKGEGTLIALEVRGSSMNRIAPAGTTIIVDCNHKILTPGKRYVFKIGGDVSFKTYKDNPPRFEPESTEPHETIFIDGQEVEVVGLVIQAITSL